RCRNRERPADGADMRAIARFAPRAIDRRRSSYRARLHPDPPQRTVHGLPLLPLRGQLCPASLDAPVVLPPAAGLGRRPLRRDMNGFKDALEGTWLPYWNGRGNTSYCIPASRLTIRLGSRG